MEGTYSISTDSMINGQAHDALQAYKIYRMGLGPDLFQGKGCQGLVCYDVA